MRLTLPLGLSALAAILAFAIAGAAFAREGVRPDQPVPVAAMRAMVDHHRTLTWMYERAAHQKRTPSAFSERRSSDRAYLQWTITTWFRRSEAARQAALAKIQRRLSVHLPAPPALHARLAVRVSYNRRLALDLRRIYPGTVTRRFASASARTGGATLKLWQRRSALAAVAVAEHRLDSRPAVAAWLNDAFLCIHRYEGSWTANTGNGYYGGLQMDRSFQSLYGADFIRQWGTADRWPPWAQIAAAARAHQSGRGFYPWPNTARACGLL